MPKRIPIKERRKLRDFNSLFQELHKETERAAAIVGAAFLDALLEEYIKGFLINDPDEIEKLFKPEQPLGAFGARITFAFCLGLITEEEKHDLRIVQWVRNKFAHELPGIAFTDHTIGTKCASLILPGQIPSLQERIGTSAREQYIAAVAILISILEFRTSEVNNQRRQPPTKMRVGYDIGRDFQ